MKKLAILPLLLFSTFFLVEIGVALFHHFGLLSTWWRDHHSPYYPWYFWVALGSVVFPLINRYAIKLKDNMKMIKKFTHELTHAVVAIMLFQRVSEFHVDPEKANIRATHDSKLSFFMILAPYCFPIYTFPLMMFRCIVIPEYYLIIDILIGISIGVHFVCFKEQTGTHQTDIKNYPIWLSYSFIASLLIFDISLILTAYLPSVNFFKAFVNFGSDFWNYTCMIFKAIF